jgi:glycosyltransferase involved in cell wall biosynthesis
MFPTTSRADLFLATLLIAPWLGPGRVVPLVYDLIPFRFPQWYGRDAIRLERRLRTAARQARIWMTISEATRSDLQEFLGIPADSIRVVYPGVDPIFRPSAPSSRRQELFNRYGIDSPYILYVGGYGAHKNVEILLRAFSLVREKSCRRCRLVLVGPRRWAKEGLAGTSDLHQDGAVSFLGYVPRDDLALLYGAAEVFLSVSLYEGFGLPALEAMACGTPVVASNAGPLPEVVGDGGILVDPTDEPAIGEALARVLTDDGLRQELRARGLRQAARFSWTEAARQTLKVFEAVRRAA